MFKIKFIPAILLLSILTSQLFSEPVDKVLAVVNGEDVTISKIAGLIQDPRFDYDKLDDNQKKKLLDSLIDEILLSQYAYTTNVVKSNEYKKALKSLKKMLASQSWKREQAQGIKVSNKELKTEYKHNQDRFVSPREFHSRHILVDNEDEARNIIKSIKKAKNKKKTFIKLAKEKSTGPSGKNGGDLGWSTPEKMVPEFSKAALLLKAGEFSQQPVRTQFGHHVLYMEGHRQSSVMPFDDVREQIEYRMKNEKIIELLKGKVKTLRGDAKIIYK